MSAEDKRPWGPNPSLYRRLSEPKSSPKAATDDIMAFFEEVAAARERHSIRDVTLLVQGTMLDPEHGERTYSTSAHFGDQTHKFDMMRLELVREAERQGFVLEMPVTP